MLALYLYFNCELIDYLRCLRKMLNGLKNHFKIYNVEREVQVYYIIHNMSIDIDLIMGVISMERGCVKMF